MTGFEALNQVLLACQSPHYSVLIVVLFIWILVCSSEPWLALVEIWQRNLSSPRTDTGAAATHKIPVAAFDVFNIFVALVLLIFSVLLDRCQHESVEVAAFIILNFGSYTLGPLKMDIFEALGRPVGMSRRAYLISISVIAFLAFLSRLACALFECFPEHDKEYKWRLGFTIIAAVLTHSPSMLVGVVMMRFRNKNQSEEEAEQDGGSSHEELDNRSEAQLNNSSEAQRDNSSDIQYAKRTVVYKTGGQIATVLLSLTLTGCFYRNIQFPVVRCICAHNVVVTTLRLRKQIARWWGQRVQAPQGDGMMFAVVIEKLNGHHHEAPLGLLLQSVFRYG